MTAATPWRNEPSAPRAVREALRVGRPSRRLSSEVRQRSAARLNRFVVVPAAAGLLFWIKGAAIASLCVAGTVAVVHQVAAIQHTKIAPGPSPLDGRASRAPIEAPTPARAPETPVAPLIEPPPLTF